ncbi:hypothetical protein, partial [Pseudoalteromonas phenolica]|uniref:hypothetical protein n=1 Tax=Pseudoalteromonas phenolica TaxID=161398 RepID=UPI001280E596
GQALIVDLYRIGAGMQGGNLSNLLIIIGKVSGDVAVKYRYFKVFRDQYLHINKINNMISLNVWQSLKK